MTWKIFDMEQCHRFLHSWQVIEPVPCTDFLKMKSWTPHASKQLAIEINWFYTNDISVPKVHSLTRCQHFLKNMRYLGHIQIIYFVDETHLTHQKSDPTDPDCPGHPTHFQPCFLPKSFSIQARYSYFKVIVSWNRSMPRDRQMDFLLQVCDHSERMPKKAYFLKENIALN